MEHRVKLQGVLDCSNPTTAGASVASLLGLDEELARVIAGSGDLDPAEVAIDEALWGRLLSAGAVAPGSYEARFFHATRVLAPDRFTSLGILRLREAIDGIWDDLYSLVPEADRETWLRFRATLEGAGRVRDPSSAALYPTKVLEDPNFHGGVYAFLLRDVALAPPSGHHDYCDIPEIVEDIVRCAPPSWNLGARFMAGSTPCLVHFGWPVADVGYLKSALEYVWVATHDGSLWNVTSAVDTKGPVPPEAILELELVIA